METRTGDGRLAAWVFDLPVVELRAGYRAAVYFDRSRRILAAEGDDTEVTMQVFQRSDAMVACGVDEALAVLALGAGSFLDPAAADQAFDAYLAARGCALFPRPAPRRPALRPPLARPRRPPPGPLLAGRGLGRGGPGPGGGRGRLRPPLGAGHPRAAGGGGPAGR